MASSTSRSLFLLSLLVCGFCMTVTATRSLQETGTNKLSLGGLDKLLGSEDGLINLIVTLDLSEVVHQVDVFVVDEVGDLVKLVVTELKKPIKVKVSVDGTVNIVVKALGKKVRVPLKLSELDPVLETVGDLDVVHVVLKLVEKVVKELNVVQIVKSVTGEILGSIIGGL